jgi:hypothetical protein
MFVRSLRQSRNSFQLGEHFNHVFHVTEQSCVEISEVELWRRRRLGPYAESSRLFIASIIIDRLSDAIFHLREELWVVHGRPDSMNNSITIFNHFALMLGFGWNIQRRDDAVIFGLLQIT